MKQLRRSSSRSAAVGELQVSDNRFWLGFWTIVGIVILGIVGTIGGCVYKTNERNAGIVSDAVGKGVDPMVVKCALLVGSSSQVSAAEAAICAAAAKK